MNTKLSGPVNVGSRMPVTAKSRPRIVTVEPMVAWRVRAIWLPMTTSCRLGSGMRRPSATRGGGTAWFCQRTFRSAPKTSGISVNGSGAGVSPSGKTTIGATAATPSIVGSAAS